MRLFGRSDRVPTTIWHTAWQGKVPGFPHEIQIDLGKPVLISRFRYLPRQDMSNGRVAAFALYISQTDRSWGSPVAKGALQHKPVARRGRALQKGAQRRPATSVCCSFRGQRERIRVSG